MKLRQCLRIVQGQETSDGAGVRLRRTVGSAALDHLDPFLLLDEFRSDQANDYIGGFPDHPHRGFETVTYMLAGRMEHRDHKGNQGNLVAGSLQWMTAGRGIIHSEMPKQEHGLMWGFQLWINLPAELKMSPPRYQDIPPEDVPTVSRDSAQIRVLAGAIDGVHGAVAGIVTEPVYLDIDLEAHSQFMHPVPEGHTAFIYAFEGTGIVGEGEQAPAGVTIGSGELGVLGDGEAVRVETANERLRFLLLAARPLGEPIARHGPFVMNTESELRQAFQDLRTGTFLD